MYPVGVLATLAAGVLTGAPIMFASAERALRPGVSLPLGGYTARGSATMLDGGEDLYARCLVLRQGGTTVAIVGFEGLTVPESLRREVARRLPSGVRLMLVATHTHCAPDTQMLNDLMTFRIPGIAVFSRRWLDWYAGQIAGIVDIAVNSEWRVAEPSLRRGFLDANRARRDGGQPDKTSWAVDFGPRGRIAAYAAHGTVHESGWMLTSGDWPGAVSRAGGGAIVLPGAIGDVSPAMDGGEPDARCSRIAEAFWRSVESAAPRRLEGELEWGSEPVLLGKVAAHKDFAKENKTTEAMAALVVTKFAPRTAKLTAVRVGDFVVLGVPGEPTGALGKRLEGAFSRRGLTCLVVSHCNGWIGYVLEPEDYLRGGYEATLSFHGPGTADRVFEAAERLAVRMAGQRPTPKR